MPVYNAERFLREAIDSVLNQTFTDFELIIADDCSKDDSWQILTEYAAADKRVVLVRNEQNMGEAGARNSGLRVARGEYIAAMDADDVLLPNRFTLQVNYLDAHPEVGVLAGQATRMDVQGNILSPWKLPTDHEVLRATLLFNNSIPHPTVMMRHGLVRQVGGYSLVFTTDYDMWWRLCRITRLAAIPQTVALIRISTEPQRISHTHAPKQLIGAQAMSLQIAREIMGERQLDGEAYQRFFMSSRGKDNCLLRSDIRRLQSLWDFLAADPVYHQVTSPKLLSTALKLSHSQPLEAIALMRVLHKQFGITWLNIAEKSFNSYVFSKVISFKRQHFHQHHEVVIENKIAASR
jgi:hypothetical protein